MNMREKMARAIAVYHGTDPDQLGPGRTHCLPDENGMDRIVREHSGPLWEMWLPEVDALLDALREPEMSILEAGYSRAFGHGEKRAMTEIWHAMIDAIKEGK